MKKSQPEDSDFFSERVGENLNPRVEIFPVPTKTRIWYFSLPNLICLFMKWSISKCTCLAY